MKQQDRERIREIGWHGNHQTSEMSEWVEELFSSGQSRKAARVLKAAENMLERRKGGRK